MEAFFQFKPKFNSRNQLLNQHYQPSECTPPAHTHSRTRLMTIKKISSSGSTPQRPTPVQQSSLTSSPERTGQNLRTSHYGVHGHLIHYSDEPSTPVLSWWGGKDKMYDFLPKWTLIDRELIDNGGGIDWWTTPRTELGEQLEVAHPGTESSQIPDLIRHVSQSRFNPWHHQLQQRAGTNRNRKAIRRISSWTVLPAALILWGLPRCTRIEICNFLRHCIYPREVEI